MITIIVIIALLVVLIAFVVALRIGESRYLRKRVVDAMSDEMWQVIEKERHASLEKGRLFRKILKEKQNELNTKSG